MRYSLSPSVKAQTRRRPHIKQRLAYSFPNMSNDLTIQARWLASRSRSSACCRGWFACDDALNSATVSSISINCSQWGSELNLKEGWSQEERRIRTGGSKRKTQDNRKANKDREMEGRTRDREGGREGGREGWIQIGVSKRWCIEERVMRVS